MSALDSNNPASSPRAARTPRPQDEERSPAPAPDLDEIGTPGIPPVLTASPTFGALLAALRRRWLLAICVTLLGGTLTEAALLYFVPAGYVSEVRLRARTPDGAQSQWLRPHRPVRHAAAARNSSPIPGRIAARW